jgi:hypothetical protein
MQAIVAPYVTLAQSTANPSLFKPVSVDIAGRAKSLPVNLRQHTIAAMVTACELYALKYGMAVRFDRCIIHRQPPAPLVEQLTIIGAITPVTVYVPAQAHPAIVAELSKVAGVVLVATDPTHQQWLAEGATMSGATWGGDYSDVTGAADRDDHVGV